MASSAVQELIVKKVDNIMSSAEKIPELYADLDNDIMELYSLSEKHRDIIRSALSGTNSFLPEKADSSEE